MSPNLNPGSVHTEQTTAHSTNTATAMGSGDVDVFATPAMIALMEKAANNCVAEMLPEGMVSVGTEINVKHFKATLPGINVWASAELTHVEGRKLSFMLKAWDENGNIGSGNHTRYIVKKEDFLKSQK